MLLLWLSLFKAETREELDKIKSMEVSVMEEAINAYDEISVSPELRELERLLFLASVNEASALHHAGEVARKEEREKLQAVIDEQAAEITLLKELLSKEKDR